MSLPRYGHRSRYSQPPGRQPDRVTCGAPRRSAYSMKEGGSCPMQRSATPLARGEVKASIGGPCSQPNTSTRVPPGIAAAAESQRHHPDMLIRYNKVTLTLSTHSAGGLTEMDFTLAKAIDEL